MSASQASCTPGSAGWFGKLAVLGDFAQRRLPPDFVRLSDAWLSRVISASRERFGARWLEIYLTAPVVRFAWAPGVADGAWWFGVLMPSCDSVGRYFPLLVAQRRARPPVDRLALDHLEVWFDHLAAAATRTLAENSSIEAFEQALAAAPPWPTPGSTSPLDSTATPAVTHYFPGPRSSPGRWLHAMAIQDLQTRLAGCTIWWRAGDGTSAVMAGVTTGLPDGEAFSRMLSG